MRRLPFGGLTLFAALALAACGGGASQAPSQAASQPAASAPAGGAACESSTETATVTTEIEAFTFAAVTAKVGDVVSWSNADSAPHSVVMDDGSCETPQFGSGESAALKFNEAGTFAYTCGVHSNMKASIVVSE
jgi:plastocyanin